MVFYFIKIYSPGHLFSLCSQRLWHHVSKESYVSVFNNIFFSSNQNTNSIPNSVLSLKVMPLKTALQFQPNPIGGVSQPMGAFVSTQTLLCVSRFAYRGALFCLAKQRKTNSVWEQSVTADGLKKQNKTKNPNKQKKQVLSPSPMACLKCFIPRFCLEHHDLFIYILTNLWNRKRWGKTWLDWNYTLSHLKYSFCTSS